MGSHNETDRKTLQLCAAAERALEMFLSGAMDELTVESVVPAPDSSHLMVTLRRADNAGPTDEELLERLSRLRGAMRSEVAAAVSRRKAPELSVRLLPADASPEAGE